MRRTPNIGAIHTTACKANVNYYDAEFAQRQIEIFQQDLERSRRVTFQEWKNRPLAEKLWENAASLFGSQL